MDVKDGVIKSIKVLPSNKIQVMVEIDYANAMDQRFGYQDAAEIRDRVSNLIANKVWEESGKEITKQVLGGVDWPELVRSKIVRNTIKEIAKGY